MFGHRNRSLAGLFRQGAEGLLQYANNVLYVSPIGLQWNDDEPALKVKERFDRLLRAYLLEVCPEAADVMDLPVHHTRTTLEDKEEAK